LSALQLINYCNFISFKKNKQITNNNSLLHKNIIGLVDGATFFPYVDPNRVVHGPADKQIISPHHVGSRKRGWSYMQQEYAAAENAGTFLLRSYSNARQQPHHSSSPSSSSIFMAEADMTTVYLARQYKHSLSPALSSFYLHPFQISVFVSNEISAPFSSLFAYFLSSFYSLSLSLSLFLAHSLTSL